MREVSKREKNSHSKWTTRREKWNAWEFFSLSFMTLNFHSPVQILIISIYLLSGLSSFPKLNFITPAVSHAHWRLKFQHAYLKTGIHVRGTARSCIKKINFTKWMRFTAQLNEYFHISGCWRGNFPLKFV